MNRKIPSLHGGSIEITLTVPLINKKGKQMDSIYLNSWNKNKQSIESEKNKVNTKKENSQNLIILYKLG